MIINNIFLWNRPKILIKRNANSFQYLKEQNLNSSSLKHFVLYCLGKDAYMMPKAFRATKTFHLLVPIPDSLCKENCLLSEKLP